MANHFLEEYNQRYGKKAVLSRGAGQLLLVAVNLSGETAEFALPVAFAGTRPLLATQGAPRPGVLRPWEGLIYCRDL